MSPERFYNEWAAKQLQDRKRIRILKWKAANLLNLYFRNDEIICDSICEIGGAEGIVIDAINSQIRCAKADNYDISKVFCEIGEKRYPEIIFHNYDFLQKPEYHDLVVLSDVTEHVDDDKIFLEKVKEYSKYLLIKIPIEKCFFNSKFIYIISFKKRPKDLTFGPSHINGHLRGYSIRQAKRFVSRFYEILDYNLSEVIYFNSSKRKKLIRLIFGRYIYILLYGGTFFGLGKSLRIKNK